MRVDVRYFRTFGALAFDFLDEVGDPDRSSRLDFARGTMGLTLRF